MAVDCRPVAAFEEGREAAHQFLLRWSAKGEVLVLAATKAAADELVREVPGPGSLGIHRVALRDMAGALATRSLAARGLAPVTALVFESLLAGAVHRVRDSLVYFGPVSRTPGFVHALAQTLGELRCARTSAETLRESGEPGRDLALLMSALSEDLRSHGLADFATILNLATQTAKGGSHRLLGIPCLFWHVHENSPAESLFREAVKERSPESLEITLKPGGAPDTALRSIRRYLFSSEQAPKRASDGSFDIFSASGEALECTEIARQIRFSGLPFDRIAILLRDPDRYEPLVAEALRRAGIPVWLARGSAQPNPAGLAFLALLRCAAGKCPAATFAEYISLGQVPNSNEEQPRPARWERLLTRASPGGSHERWRIRFNWLRGELQEEWELEALCQLEYFALPLVERLWKLPQSGSWGEWLNALSVLAEAGLRQPGEVLELLDELRPMEQVGPVDLETVIATLSQSLATLRMRAPESPYGRVWAGPIEAASGLSFRLVFLPGLAEGRFPRRVSHDPLLLDTYRARIGHELRMQSQRAEAERDLLRRSAACASERLVASYPRMDVFEARRRVPSLYAFELLRAAEGWLPGELGEFERRTRITGESALGWPAPANPGSAIDDAEYDLSLLQKARSSPDPKGALAHLKGAHPHLVNALRARAQRWVGKWHAPDGFVDPEIESGLLIAQHSLKQVAYSPSALQHFAACPYRFYLRHIARLRPMDRVGEMERMEPGARGEIFHAVQFSTFRELKARNLAPVRPETLQEALAVANDQLDTCAARFTEALVPQLPGIWRLQIEELRSDLHGWLADVAERDADWIPAHQELAFGLRDRRTYADDLSTGEPVSVMNGFLLSGSIDLVERRIAGGVLRITDHKTGAPPDPVPNRIGGGRALQPVLYALAAEQLLGEPAISGRLFYTSHRQSFKRVEIVVNDAARQTAERALRIIDDAVRDGFLPAAPSKQACVHCDFREVCGPHEEERIRIKPRDRMRALDELRELP